MPYFFFLLTECFFALLLFLGSASFLWYQMNQVPTMTWMSISSAGLFITGVCRLFHTVMSRLYFRATFSWLLILYGMNMFLSTLAGSGKSWHEEMPWSVPVYLVTMFLAVSAPVYGGLVARERPCSHKVAALIGVACGLTVPVLNALVKLID